MNKAPCCKDCEDIAWHETAVGAVCHDCWSWWKKEVFSHKDNEPHERKVGK